MDNHLASLLDLPAEDAHEEALRIVMELGIHTVGAEEGSMLEVDGDSGDLVFVMTAGDMLTESVLRGQHVSIGQGLTGQAALTGEVKVGAPASLSVLQSEHRGQKAPSYLIAAPMLAGGNLLGVLTAATYRDDARFSDDQVRMFARVAALAAIVVAERRRSRYFEGRASGASVDGVSDGQLGQQLAETLQRLARGDESRLRRIHQLLDQVASLAGG